MLDGFEAICTVIVCAELLAVFLIGVIAIFAMIADR